MPASAHITAQLQQASAQLQQLKLLLQVAEAQLCDSSRLNALLQWEVSALRSEAPTAHDAAGSAAADMVRLLVTEDSTTQLQSSSSSSGVPLAPPAQPTSWPARGVPPPRPPPGSPPPPVVVRAVLPPRPPPLPPAPGWLPSRPPAAQPLASAASALPPSAAEPLAYILQLQRGLWTTDECRRRARKGADVRLYRLLPSSLQPEGAYAPRAPHDLYSYLCLKEAIRACTACRNCRDKIIRHAKRLDALNDLPAFNPLVLVHAEVLAAIRAQSARTTSTSAFGTERRSLADLGVGSLTRLALQLQAAMQAAPWTEWFQGGSSDSF